MGLRKHQASNESDARMRAGAGVVVAVVLVPALSCHPRPGMRLFWSGVVMHVLMITPSSCPEPIEYSTQNLTRRFSLPSPLKRQSITTLPMGWNFIQRGHPDNKTMPVWRKRQEAMAMATINYATRPFSRTG